MKKTAKKKPPKAPLRVIGLKEFKEGLSGFIESCQTERTIIMKHNRPVAILQGVAGQELADFFYEKDPELLAMLRERLADKRPGVTLDEFKQQLQRDKRAAKPASKKKPAPGRSGTTARTKSAKTMKAARKVRG